MTIEAEKARPFKACDVVELLGLMRRLAEFEGYAADFNITEEDLVLSGLCDDPAFRAYVVPRSGTTELLGMAVTYQIDWTYVGRPNVVLKELFVRPDARGAGVGQSLMDAVLQAAREIGAFKLLWTVLPSNYRAKKFYSALGAAADASWENWEIQL